MAGKISISESVFLALRGVMEKLKEESIETVYFADLDVREEHFSACAEKWFRTIEIRVCTGYAGTLDNPVIRTFHCSVSSSFRPFGWELEKVYEIV